MKVLLIWIILVAGVLSAQDALLTLSRSNSCLRDLVSSFVRADDCASLHDQEKTKLAIRMSECLLREMGKTFPKECSRDASACRLEGDAWSTFSTFFAHIDNLCHFYWETLHHQRAERLIGELSESSSKAEEVLRDNAEETRRILTLQHRMHSSLEESLLGQQRMADLVNSSSMRITNLTVQIQTFVQRIHEDIDANYASLRSLLGLINEGVVQVVEMQGYIRAEITSISGIVYFLAQLLVVLFVTSFRKYRNCRSSLVSALAIEAAIQVTFSSLLMLTPAFGLKHLRYTFLAGMGLFLMANGAKDDHLEAVITECLATPRLERAFRSVAEEQSKEWTKNMRLSSMVIRAGEEGSEVQWAGRRQLGPRECESMGYG